MAKKKKKTKKGKLVKSAASSINKKKKKKKATKSKKTTKKNTKKTSASAGSAITAASAPSIPSGMGSFGSTIVFETSGNRLLPFSDMKREVSGRWKEHEILGQKPKSEFCGPDAQEVKMTVTLLAEHGVKPRSTMDAIAAACESGTIDYLVIGGKIVGSGKMKIVSVSEAWERVLNKGELTKAVLDLVFKEYS